MRAILILSTIARLCAANRDWDESNSLAKNLVAKLTLEEKVTLATGIGWMHGPCVGNTAALEKHGYSGLCLEDSPLGVRFADFASVFPAGINTAATWDRDLIRQRGIAMGEEFRGKGVNVALGPMMNMGRVAMGGRNFEGFGADPYLTGEAAFETIVGMQSTGVQACAKHYVDNEQETGREIGSSNVDDRTQHEIYLHPFLRSIQAGVASIMCSYNKVNGTYACENPVLLNSILKGQMAFQGYVMSDWWATHSTMSAATGLDMTMPGDLAYNDGTIPFASYFGANLTEAVQKGNISVSRVDDMATRILSAWYHLRQDDKDYPKTNLDAWAMNGPKNGHVDVQGDHFKLIRKIGAASTVLLKNTKGTLPLKKPRSIILVGSDAGPAIRGPNGYPDRGGLDGTLAVGWGSGTADFPYLITPLEAIQARARKDRSSVSWWLDDLDTKGAATAAVAKDAAMVFIAADSGEAYISVDGNAGDRKNMTAWHGGDDLVLAIAAVNPNTVVIVHSTGPLIVEPWIDHPNVTAVLWAGLPGQESGNSLTDVLYGDWNPSAKLPYTIAKSPEDYGAQIDREGLNVNYTEGLNIDYRHFDAKDIAPRFPFGFGLSYTKFEYSDLDIRQNYGYDSPESGRWANGDPGSSGNGSSIAEWLHSPVWTVSFDVENTGHVDGAEVAQLYLSLPKSTNSPPSILKGFTTVHLAPGESKTVKIQLTRYDLSVWSTVKQGWVAAVGTTGVTVGSHSRDARLKGSIKI